MPRASSASPRLLRAPPLRVLSAPSRGAGLGWGRPSGGRDREGDPARPRGRGSLGVAVGACTRSDSPEQAGPGARGGVACRLIGLAGRPLSAAGPGPCSGGCSPPAGCACNEPMRANLPEAALAKLAVRLPIIERQSSRNNLHFSIRKDNIGGDHGMF